MSVTDQYSLTVYGEAVVSYGLEVRDAVDGFGLLTRGMVWQCPNIWTDGGASLTTSWSQSATGSSISTTWGQSQGGLFGEC